MKGHVMHTPCDSLRRMAAALSVLLALALTGGAVQPQPAGKVRIVLVGDSTVTDGSVWGMGFKPFLTGQGSVVFARLVVEELRKAVPQLAPCLRNEPTESPASRVFNVRDYGAKGDGKTVDTAAIQKAIDTCGKAGGGVVRLTTGTYLSQPIILRSKTTLQLDEGAILQATTQHADFMKTPPTLLIHGDADQVVDLRHSWAFHEAMMGLQGISAWNW